MTSFINAITKRKRTPDQLVSYVRQSLDELINCPPSVKDGSEKRQSSIDVSAHSEEVPLSSEEVQRQVLTQNLLKYLTEMRTMLVGDAEHPSIDEERVKELSRAVQSDDFLYFMTTNLRFLPLEARKDLAIIYTTLLKKNIERFSSYVESQWPVIKRFVLGYSDPDLALICGMMLRESIKSPIIARQLLQSDLLWRFFDTYVHQSIFDVASDAFNILKELFSNSDLRAVQSEFLEQHQAQFIAKYELLLMSNYITRRMALKLLAELLLIRANYSLMMAYISSKDNLKTIMNLLRDKSPAIQFEAFHVFKIFVANPKKTAEISSVLYNNQAKLLAYLETFHNDKNDSQFLEEKRLLIDTLQGMHDPSPSSSSSSAAGAPSAAEGSGKVERRKSFRKSSRTANDMSAAVAAAAEDGSTAVAVSSSSSSTAGVVVDVTSSSSVASSSAHTTGSSRHASKPSSPAARSSTHHESSGTDNSTLQNSDGDGKQQPRSRSRTASKDASSTVADELRTKATL